jgi:hypothetical protein
MYPHRARGGDRRFYCRTSTKDLLEGDARFSDVAEPPLRILVEAAAQ